MNNLGNLGDQDPDYAAPGPSTNYQQKIYEETARTNASRKITSIIDREFSLEIDAKEKEILQIQEKLDTALKTLHFLRYVIISDFYNRKQCLSNPPPDVKQVRLHPAIRSATGKSPKSQAPLAPHTSPPVSSLKSLDRESSSDCSSSSLPNSLPPNPHEPCNPLKRSPDKTDPPPEPPRKIPRYVPPKTSQPDPKIPSRGVRHKICKRIVVGNISKWIPPDWREDAASHKWTMYVRASKEDSDISEFVSKVRFFLHPSYRPNDVVDVTSSPFHLCRRGWGEFPLRVQLHFKNQNNKPMDIIHHLKLDRTYTGLQTLGSETVVDIWINTLACDAADKMAACDAADKMAACEPSTKWPPPTAIKLDNESVVAADVLEHSLGIKEEKTDEEEVRVLSYVHFEHDYASFGRSEEANVTIAHSPERVVEINRQNCHNDNIQDTLASSATENHQNSPIIQNGESPRKNSVQNSEVQIFQKILDNRSSLLQPLKIAIPSHFESLNLKKSEKPLQPKIIVVKDNDRVIKLNIAPSKKAVSLLKKPRAPVNLVLDPAKSIILNSASNIPVLKIAEAREKPNGKMPKAKVTIGKDRTKLGSKREFYDGILRSLEEVRIPGDIDGVMRFIIKRIPIVSPHSGDPEYRRLHPYVCGSDEEFLGFNPGKQRALEWYRAKEVCRILRRRGVEEVQMWTIKEVMMWCRLHGFTPVRRERGRKTEMLVDVGDEREDFSTCTESGEFIEWLQEGGEEVVEDEEVVDVVGMTAEGAKVVKNAGVKDGDGSVVTMEVPKTVEAIYSYVCASVRQIGVKLEGEEVLEGVRHDAAGRVLAKAVECLMEDLLRSSLAQSFQRTGSGSSPERICLDDVRAAIVNRDVFDIFTNNGLGSQNDE